MEFRLDLIPVEAIRQKFGVVPVTVPEEPAEGNAWWSDVQPPHAFETYISAFLPEIRSWSKTMRLWGDERGDTASVCYTDENRVEWIGFRVDVRELRLSYVRFICEFAERVGCMLMTAKYELLPPSESMILFAIKNSPSQKYLEDPVATLRDLKPGDGGMVRFPKQGT